MRLFIVPLFASRWYPFVGLAVLLLSSGATPVAALAQDVTVERPAMVHPYAGHVADAARRFGIPEAWVWAVMRVESNGDARAVSTAGAMGLMQVMPATWAELRARYGLGADPYEVRDNIMAGAAYLREMFDRYGNATAMLAAYNAGPGRYDEHLSRGRSLPAETRAYLVKLAAIAGSMDNTRRAAAPVSDPLAWRSAALFSVRSSDIRVALQTTEDMASNALSEPPTGDHAEPALADASSPRDSLFVPLSGRHPQ